MSSVTFQGPWSHSFVETDDLHEIRIDTEVEAILTSIDGESRRFSISPDPVRGWCLAMRKTRMAMWSSMPHWIAIKELVDPNPTLPPGLPNLRLERDRLRWRSTLDSLRTSPRRSALDALLLSPTLLLDRFDPLEDAPVLWPVPATPDRAEDSVSGTRIVDVLPAGRGHSVILDLDLDGNLLTPRGAAPRPFPTQRAMIEEAIGIRMLIEHDPGLILPDEPAWDSGPANGWDPWISLPELGVSACQPEFNGRYWACNWHDGAGEERCSYGTSPLHMLKALLRRAASGLAGRTSA